MRRKSLKGCKYPSRNKWNKIKNKSDNDVILSACEFSQLNNSAYGCRNDRYSWGFKNKENKQIGLILEKNLYNYQNKLKNTKILNQDYKMIVKNYDSKDTFFYIDPPYHKLMNYGFESINPKDVASNLKNIKGKVMISYNDHPDVRKAFPRSEGWHLKHIDVPYTVYQNTNSIKEKNHKKELLITNY